mmetsp:Transcript_35466/g.72536  ORF Transcript_35466/g.72536 Transcript_35466/m.72536 type:complete len:514 (+) Transcript_35466:128-1669(+)
MMTMSMKTILSTICLFVSTTKAERVVIHEIQQAQREHRATAEGSPFLSATLLASITPLDVSSIGESQKSAFTTALTSFMKHVFENQSVYDVEIISTTIFDEQFVSNTKNVRGRNLLTNQLQAGQFHFIHDDEDDEYGDEDWEGDDWTDDGHGSTEDEEEALSVMNAILGESDGGKEDVTDDATDESDWVVDESELLPDDADSAESEDAYTLKVTTVISAEHIADDRSLSHSEFQQILLHVCHKFVDHLVEFVRDSDAYFASVENVTVSALGTDSGESSETMIGSAAGFDLKGLSAASIVGIVAAGIVFVLGLIGSIKLVKREQQLKRNKWRSQEIASANAAEPSVKSLRVLYNRSAGDDYSFDPFGTETPPTLYKDNDSDTSSYTADHDSNEHLRFRKSNGVVRDESVSFVSHPTETDSSLFGGNSTSPSQEHIYAPPGKVGVAIDVINGKPTVHKIRNGSPLEGLLQHGDVILSIDDVETSNMSAADVTQLMVKRMHFRRKISFIRSGNQIQ